MAANMTCELKKYISTPKIPTYNNFSEQLHELKFSFSEHGGISSITVVPTF